MPSYNNLLDTTPLSVFEELETEINKTNHPNFIRLHQGKTVFPSCATLDDWKASNFSLLAHQHASPLGIKDLKQRIVDDFLEKKKLSILEKNILITCGATHGISTVLKTILKQDEEVLILSPQWLFIVGLVRAAGGHAVEVPVFLELNRDPAFNLISALRAKLTSKTKALYFNNPNNPTGYSLNKETLLAIASFAKENDLWIISDNAYENYDFTHQGFTDIAAFKDINDRTFSVYTFSKTYAMPGYRVGYVMVPDCMENRIKKWGLYSIYSLATSSQYGAFKALATSNEVLEKYKNEAKIASNIVNDKLIVPHTEIQGGFYTLLDLKDWPKGIAKYFWKECIQAGVSIAPGIAFGEHCAKYARLCFMAVNKENLEIGLERINRVYSG